MEPNDEERPQLHFEGPSSQQFSISSMSINQFQQQDDFFGKTDSELPRNRNDINRTKNSSLIAADNDGDNESQISYDRSSIRDLDLFRTVDEEDIHVYPNHPSQEEYRALQLRVIKMEEMIGLIYAQPKSPQSTENPTSTFDDMQNELGKVRIEVNKLKVSATPQRPDFSKSASSILRRNLSNKLAEDAFSLMMISDIRSKAWVLSLGSFVFQMSLISMICADQIGESIGSSLFNVPFEVTPAVRSGQFLSILFCVSTQSDIITSFRSFVLFWKDTRWDQTLLGQGQKSERPRFSKWILHIVVPNVFKLLQGILVLFVTFVVIVQSGNIIELLKDFTALMVISETDNVLFQLAAFGYLGHDLEVMAAAVRDIRIEEADAVTTHVRDGKFRLIRPILLLSVALGMISGWVGIVINQKNGTYFEQRYPNCAAPGASDSAKNEMFQSAKKHFFDSVCYGGLLNTLGCGFEGGDCVNFNQAYPLCRGENLVMVQESVGNGKCEEDFRNAECDFDGGDCCPYQLMRSPLFGDGQCHGGPISVKGCGYDNNDCLDFIRDFQDCPLDKLANNRGSDKVILGNGICESNMYNIESCGYEYGDCAPGQIGQIIFGGVASYTRASLKFDVKMSSDGSTVAIGLYRTDEDEKFSVDSAGLVKVYAYDSSARIWTRKGQNILGKVGVSKFGYRLAMSANGKRLAVSSENQSGTEGFVDVFDYSEATSGWAETGKSIMSDENDGLGKHIDMIADGSRLAISSPNGGGAVGVYTLNTKEGRWTSIFKKKGFKQQNYGGNTLKINFSDGSRIILSAKLNETHHVFRAFEQNASMTLEGPWYQLGDDNDILIKNLKTSAINSKGSRIAISSSSADITSGKVQVFEWKCNSTQWSQMGNSIHGTKASSDGFGHSISMDFNGTKLAISSIERGCDGDPELCVTGTVELYVYDPKNHQFISAPPASNRENIVKYGRDRKEIFGYHVSLNGDGTLISISGYDLAQESGFVKLFRLDDLFYTRCFVPDPKLIGNGICDEKEDPSYTSQDCDYDGRDCPAPRSVDDNQDCFVSYPDKIGNKICDDFPPYNTEKCGFDGDDCVTTAPSASPPTISLMPSQHPTRADNKSHIRVRLTLKTDYYPAEISWNLMDSSSKVFDFGPAIGESYEHAKEYTFEWSLERCLSYTFTINDSFGDGLTSGGDGYFQIEVQDKKQFEEVNSINSIDGKKYGLQDVVHIKNYCLIPTASPSSMPSRPARNIL